jgi:hypothetical protein
MNYIANKISTKVINQLESRLILTMYKCVDSTTYELLTDRLRYDLYHNVNNKPIPKRNREEDWLS